LAYGNVKTVGMEREIGWNSEIAAC